MGKKKVERKAKADIELWFELMKNQQEQQEGVDSLVCPSFSSYTSDKLADIADQVSRDYFRALGPQNDSGNDSGSCRTDNNFEFVTFRKAADGIFFEGRVGPVFPIFNRDLLTVNENGGEEDRARDSCAEDDVMAVQFPTSKLLIHDPDHPSSSSSSEVDDLEEIPPGTYCLWTPNSATASPNRCKKSSSTGSSSSKRWKLLDFLLRSHSDGKDSFVFLTPSSSGSSLAKKKEVKVEISKQQWSSGSTESTKVAGNQKSRGAAVARDGQKKVSAHEAFYVRNRELRKGDKRRSYLPYRQDLVGFFASFNGTGRPSPSTSF